MLRKYENGPLCSQKKHGKDTLSLQLFILMQMWGSLAGWSEGEGDQGKCNWGISLWGPTQIPNVPRAENKISMGAAPATLAPSIDAPSATQKHWGLSPTTVLAGYSPPHAGKNLYCHHESSADEVGACVIRLFGSRPASQRELTPTGSSPAGSCLYEASVHGGMWLGLGNFTVD